VTDMLTRFALLSEEDDHDPKSSSSQEHDLESPVGKRKARVPPADIQCGLLSGGQRRRVSVAISLISDPKVSSISNLWQPISSLIDDRL